MTNSDLHRILDPGAPELRHEEAMRALAAAYPGGDCSIVNDIKKDVFRLFAGEYPGYKACNTKYHDLNHTTSVVLAAARLLHGAAAAGEPLPARFARLCMAAAYFHDVGLIQTDEENEGTGARFTVGHEDRSIEFMSRYFADKGMPKADIAACEAMINCTILALDPRSLPFSVPETRIAGFVLGTADLEAQLAERTYLEKLLLLYQEFQEAGIPGFSSALELLKKTEDFYSGTAKVRLNEHLENTARFMRSHFAAQNDLDRDLYAESIQKNIDYISFLTSNCEDRLDCFEGRLKRTI